MHPKHLTPRNQRFDSPKQQTGAVQLDNAVKKRLQYDNFESQTHWRDMASSQIVEKINEPKFKPRTRQSRLVDERDIARQVYNLFSDGRKARRKEWERMTGGQV